MYTKKTWLFTLALIGGLALIIWVISDFVKQSRAQSAVEEARRTNAETCRYIMGYDRKVKDPFHMRRQIAACSHFIIEKGGTIDDAAEQCFPVIDACEQGLAR